MKTYRSRIFVVKASEFTGGIYNAQEILGWINHNGGTAVWCGAIAPYQYADGRVKHPGSPEGIRIKTPTGWRIVPVGDIIAEISAGCFNIFTKEEFDRVYEEDPNEKLADVVALPTRNRNAKLLVN